MSIARIAVLAGLIAGLGACGGGKGDAAAAQSAASAAPVARNVATLTLPAVTAAALGQAAQVAAVARDSSGAVLSGVALIWSVADPTVATVDASGTVTPRRAGFTTVSASANGVTASATLSIRGPLALPTRSQYVGTNLTGIAYWTTQFPFADLVKNSGGWGSREDNGTWGAPFPSLTADGYPAALKPGQHALNAVAWSGVHYPAGQYVILWDGDGTLSFPLSNVRVASSAANRIVLDVTDTSGPLWVGIDTTSPTNPVHNVRFLWPGTEATFAAQPFNPAYLAKIAPFSVLRFMDWGATNGSAVVEWADRSHVGDVTYAAGAGVPIEVMVDLANTLHTDPWFCIPHQASDDYVKQFATLLHGRLDPGLHPHIEYSNEVWNWGFAQTNWAVAQSDKLGLPRPWGTPSAFYAQRAVQIFRLMQAVYGPADSARLVRVIAGQAAWTQFQENALGWQDTAANADVMAVAPYFQAAAADDAAAVATTLALTSDQIVDQMLVSVRGDMKSWIVANAALAKKYNLKMKAYESGPGDTSFSFPADKQDAMTALFAAANRNPRMRDVYREFYGLWVGNGGDTMNQYSDIGTWSKWGFWGSLEYVTQDPATAPKYQGLIDFIAAHPSPP